MTSSSVSALWERIRHDAGFRAAAVYAAVSWFLIEAADTLGFESGTIRWLAILLGAGFLALLMGLVAVRMTRRRRVHHEPGDIAAATAASPRRAGRAWLAVIAVLVLLASGMFAVRAGSLRAAVPEAAQQMAILPFHASGSDAVREFGTGMVDLLAAALNDVAGIRTVATRTVLAQVGDATEGLTPDEEALALGRRLGAASVLTGSITAFGTRVRLRANLRQTTNGTVLAEAQIEGALDSVLTLTDQLALRLLRDMWRSRAPMPTVNAAALTTTSPAALRSYLRGEDHLRGMRFDSARRYFDDAVTEDSLFALAWMRLAEVSAWTTHTDKWSYIARAAATSDRLPERERAMLRALQLEGEHSWAAFDSFQAYVHRYPDDPMGWYALADMRFHNDVVGRFETHEVIRPFLRSAELDPSLGLGLFHVLEIALRDDDRALYDFVWAKYEPIAPEQYASRYRLLASLRWAPPDSVPARFSRALRQLEPDRDWRTIYMLTTTLEQRIRLDGEYDPRVTLEAMDSLSTIHARITTDSDDSSLYREANFIRIAAFFAMGWPDSALATLDRVFDGAPSQYSPVDRALWRMWPLYLGDVPIERVAEDALFLESQLSERPDAFYAVYEFHRRSGHAEALRRYDREFDARSRAWLRALPPGPEMDSTAALQLAEAYYQIARGDTVGGVENFDRALFALDIRSAYKAGFLPLEYGMWLVAIPERRAQGIRVLRSALTARDGTIAAYQTLARALEAEGDLEGARSAHAHIVRLLDQPQPFRQPARDEALRALARLASDR